MTFAEKTKVPVARSKDAIETLVKRHEAEAFGVFEQNGVVKIFFRLSERNILFQMPVPDDLQMERSIWRAMLLTIKGKLESADRGIETIEEAFMANVVMQDGRTVAQHARPAIEAHYSGDTEVPLLPAPAKGA